MTRPQFLLGALTLTAIALLATTSPAAASHIVFPLSEVASTSHRIVVARLTEFHQVQAPTVLEPQASYTYFEATLLVEQSLWPPESRDSLLTLRWSTRARPPSKNGGRIEVVTSDIHWDRRKEERVLWFLRDDGSGANVANGANAAVSLVTDESVRSARLEFTVRERIPNPPPSAPSAQPWKASPRWDRVKTFLDQTLAELAAKARD